jgi:hypothetical protein
MTRWRTQEPDLFETPPPSAEIHAPQRAMALALVEALLTEALITPAMRSAAVIATEADHDEDHA